MEKKESSVAFWVMMVILAYMLITCIILPIALTGNEGYMAVRLPLMIIALAAPFAHFFIFAGIEIVREKK
ncbi:MAG: hypothetical protein LBL23_00970 [Coriobacteriales bacterium]|jgi:hypothetical protein|nr:hypothetical protein [Coriobacteriales bacterium]